MKSLVFCFISIIHMSSFANQDQELLIKKEAHLEKGSGNPLLDKVADLRIEQIIKIAKMKRDSMHTNNLKSAVKNVIGSANSMGILIENKKAIDINVDVNAGKYDDLISKELTAAREKRGILSANIVFFL